MSEQDSQKRGVKSSAQKEAAARDAYATIPPSQPVAGAFGEHKKDTPTDEDVSLAHHVKRSSEGKGRQAGKDND